MILLEKLQKYLNIDKKFNYKFQKFLKININVDKYLNRSKTNQY
jgi:hypothetical protein